MTGYAYDGSGQQLIVTNALGEYTVKNFDAIGRVTTNAVFDPSGNRMSPRRPIRRISTARQSPPVPGPMPLAPRFSRTPLASRS
jgi:hypothetical protein